jgi:hypothetical protein
MTLPLVTDVVLPNVPVPFVLMEYDPFRAWLGMSKQLG